jgi:hypothetical protein
MIQATEMLLQELPANKAVLRARLNEVTPIRTDSKAGQVSGSNTIKAAL